MDQKKIENLINSMSPAQMDEAIKTIKALEDKKRTGRIYGWKPNPAQIPIFACQKRIRLIRGGNRCIAGFENVYDPVDKIWKRIDKIEGDFHVEAWDGWERVTALAHKPYSKGVDKMLLLKPVGEDGVAVSEAHVVMTSKGWRKVGEIAKSGNIEFVITPECEKLEIESITEIGPREVWDFEVPQYENYVVGGFIHHNSGKTEASAFETALHATGLYPDWWEGIRFNQPIEMGVVSVDAAQMVKGVQRKLMGPPDEWGTGLIPRDKILLDELKVVPQTNGCLERAMIKHASGGTSRIYFMTFGQNIKSFMGFNWQWALFDEEPPWKYFEEVQMRMLDTGGYIMLSFYPPDGQTELLCNLDKMAEKTPEFFEEFYLEWKDNPTLNEDMVEMMEKTMSDEQKESRKFGRTGVAEGRCFPWSRDKYVIDPFEIEPHWRQVAGLDVGFGHPTGAVRMAIDDLSGCLYIFDEYLNIENLPPVHAAALRKWGDIDFYIDPSSRRRAPTDGNNLFEMYSDEGLNIIKGNNAVQTSINVINTMIAERKFFIFSTCRELIKQMGLYRKVKNPKTGSVDVVRKDNDLIDPMRYAIMDLSNARVPGVPRNKYRSIKLNIDEWKPFDSKLGV